MNLKRFEALVEKYQHMNTPPKLTDADAWQFRFKALVRGLRTADFARNTGRLEDVPMSDFMYCEDRVIETLYRLVRQQMVQRGLFIGEQTKCKIL